MIKATISPICVTLYIQLFSEMVSGHLVFDGINNIGQPNLTCFSGSFFNKNDSTMGYVTISVINSPENCLLDQLYIYIHISKLAKTIDFKENIYINGLGAMIKLCHMREKILQINFFQLEREPH